MKKHLHRIFATLLALAMVLSLAACGSSGEPQSGASGTNSSDDVVNVGCTSSISHAGGRLLEQHVCDFHVLPAPGRPG